MKNVVSVRKLSHIPTAYMAYDMGTEEIGLLSHWMLVSSVKPSGQVTAGSWWTLE